MTNLRGMPSGDAPFPRRVSVRVARPYKVFLRSLRCIVSDERHNRNSVRAQLLEIGHVSALEAMHIAAILVVVCAEIATAARALLQEYSSL